MRVTQVTRDLKFRHGVFQLERGEALSLALDAVEDRNGFVGGRDLSRLGRRREHRLHLVAGLLASLQDLLGRLVLLGLFLVRLELRVGGDLRRQPVNRASSHIGRNPIVGRSSVLHGSATQASSALWTEAWSISCPITTSSVRRSP